MKVLIAGFEKWGKYKTNPAQQIAEKLNGKTISGAKIIGIALPVDFHKLPVLLRKAIRKNKPNVVITLGLAFKNLDKISIETIARKKIHPPFPDNKCKWPNNSKKGVDYDVVNNEKGPMTRKTKLPVHRIISKLKKAHIQVLISKDAGGHMCEQCLYLGQHLMEKYNLKGISGHLHLPHSPSCAKDVKSKKFMKLNKIKKGIEIAIKESILSLKPLYSKHL